MRQVIDFLSGGTSTWFQPAAIGDVRAVPDDGQIQKRLALLVGLVAFFLPIILWSGAVIFQSCFRDSLSHFYYAQFLGPIFVGLLVFIGGFLIALTGDHWLEDVGSAIAGVGAFLVAVFPTTGSGCEKPSAFLSRVFVTYTNGETPVIDAIPDRGFFKLFENVDNLHTWGAGILFAYLGLYCLVVLKRIIPARHICDDILIASKRRRNVVYSLCGLIILACVLILGYVGLRASPEFQRDWNADNLTFYVESAALWAFAMAWFTKGRRFTWLNDPVPPDQAI